MIEQIRDNPQSRRILMSAWNPADLRYMALPPCHVLYHVRVIGGKLKAFLYQRSCDVFLGVPFNIASYATLTHMIAHVTGLEAAEFVHQLGDVHLYENHVEQAQTQVDRMLTDAFPTLEITKDTDDIEQIDYDGNSCSGNSPEDKVYGDFTVSGYRSYPTIKAEVAV